MVVFTVIECGREILVALEGQGIGIILLLVVLLMVGILLLGASVTTTRGCRQRLGEAADGLNRRHCSESGGFRASSSTGAHRVRESRAH